MARYRETGCRPRQHPCFAIPRSLPGSRSGRETAEITLLAGGGDARPDRARADPCMGSALRQEQPDDGVSPHRPQPPLTGQDCLAKQEARARVGTAKCRRRRPRNCSVSTAAAAGSADQRQVGELRPRQARSGRSKASQSAKSKACKARSRSGRESKGVAAAGAAGRKSASAPDSAGPSRLLMDCLVRGALQRTGSQRLSMTAA